MSAPYAGAPLEAAPEGMNGNTPWIWLYIVLPLLSLIPLFFIDFSDFAHAVAEHPNDLAVQNEATAALLFQPAMIVAQVLGWVIIAVTIVLAYLDYREIKRRGMPQPFHWAFAFLSLAGFGVVYSIGRGVVTKRRLGKGYGILLAAILSIVLIVVVVIVWTGILIVQVVTLLA